MGWIRVAITVDHHNRESSHGAEESHANTASQVLHLSLFLILVTSVEFHIVSLYRETSLSSQTETSGLYLS